MTTVLKRCEDPTCQHPGTERVGASLFCPRHAEAARKKEIREIKMSTLKIVKLSTDAEKTTRTTLDTIEITPNLVRSWKLPEFQRPLRVNDKVLALAEQIKRDEGVVPGILTIGVLDRVQYIIDGQHRREAFLISECVVGYVDVRIHYFDSIGEMGEEFVNLNSRIVNMRPDDILRGLERSSESLTALRKRCPYIGYDMIRRNEKAPVLSMSAVLRCWNASSKDSPATTGGSATTLVKSFDTENANQLATFLDVVMGAWGRDAAYSRLWLNLNLTMCMWLYRRMVLTAYSAKTLKLTRDVFGKCMMSLSADSVYLDWLVGRNLGERDRAPAYSRIRAIMAKRIEAEIGKKPLMPAPEWSSSSGGHNRQH